MVGYAEPSRTDALIAGQDAENVLTPVGQPRNAVQHLVRAGLTHWGHLVLLLHHAVLRDGRSAIGHRGLPCDSNSARVGAHVRLDVGGGSRGLWVRRDRLQ